MININLCSLLLYIITYYCVLFHDYIWKCIQIILHLFKNYNLFVTIKILFIYLLFFMIYSLIIIIYSLMIIIYSFIIIGYLLIMIYFLIIINNHYNLFIMCMFQVFEWMFVCIYDISSWRWKLSPFETWRITSRSFCMNVLFILIGRLPGSGGWTDPHPGSDGQERQHERTFGQWERVVKIPKHVRSSFVFFYLVGIHRQ